MWLHRGVCQCKKVKKAALILAKSKQHYKMLTYPFLADIKMHAHGVYKVTLNLILLTKIFWLSERTGHIV